jgi:enolase
MEACDRSGASPASAAATSAALQEGWVIANHILVSFHVAFISSVLALPSTSLFRWEVLQFIFASPETLVSAVFAYLSFHLGIALHEMGHFLTAARLDALNERALLHAKERLRRPLALRFLYYLELLGTIPIGRAFGITREGLNYYPDAPYNLAVAAAGPRTSRNTALATLPAALGLIAAGVIGGYTWSIYTGRLLLGVGVVSLLDFWLADRGKYAAFRARERLAVERARAVGAPAAGWLETAPGVKRRMLDARMQQATHERLGPVTAPWQFRNCGMGGRHTEKEYPESNVSMQEAMFLILGAHGYQEAQELTVRLQSRLKEIIESEEGCRVMGIGLEGGLAPYIEKGSYPLPEARLWAMMKRTIAECGCRPGVDVAIALDPAMSELETAYRAEFNLPDSVGMYLFWRDKAKTVLDRDGVLDLYATAIGRYEIPILSIEDGFSEHDHEGWRLLRRRLGDRIFIIGDDLVTTNDRTIEHAAQQGLINCVLVKANQIGSLSETLLAMLVALGKGLELVVSHRSKSPNDDMEAHVALATNALGLKAGGGANTERLVKYQAVTELLLGLDQARARDGLTYGEQAIVRKIRAYEEPTNAGIPTVGATVEVGLPAIGVSLAFKGATPLGTSAGSGEAIHLVDATLEYAEWKEVVDRFPALFREVEPGVRAFRAGVDEARVRAEADEALTGLFRRAQRYGGKGCLGAVDNVLQILAPAFEGRDLATLTLLDVDRTLLHLELRTARRRGKLADGAGEEERTQVMQRKQNIGMNAMLSVSLALGRAIARVQGKELYEVLREEMLSAIDRLTGRYGVTLEGSRLADYVVALRQVAELVEREGKPLHAVLREVVGLYVEPGREVAPEAPAAGEAGLDARRPARVEPLRHGSEGPMAETEEAVLVDLDRALHAVLGSAAEPDIHRAVRLYLEAKSRLGPPRSPLRSRQQPGLPRGRRPDRAVSRRRRGGSARDPGRVPREAVPTAPAARLHPDRRPHARTRRIHRHAGGSGRTALPVRPGAHAGLRDRADPRRGGSARAGQRDREPQRGGVPAPVSHRPPLQSLGPGFPRRQEPAARDPRADQAARPLSQRPTAPSPAAPFPSHRPQSIRPGRQAEPDRSSLDRHHRSRGAVRPGERHRQRASTHQPPRARQADARDRPGLPSVPHHRRHREPRTAGTRRARRRGRGRARPGRGRADPAARGRRPAAATGDGRDRHADRGVEGGLRRRSDALRFRKLRRGRARKDPRRGDPPAEPVGLLSPSAHLGRQGRRLHAPGGRRRGPARPHRGGPRPAAGHGRLR